MDLKQQFDEAALASKTLSEKPSNEILLQLYSLYKQSTEGDISADPPSNAFDFVNIAKHNAWASLKGKTKDSAMQDYVDLIQKLRKN